MKEKRFQVRPRVSNSSVSLSVRPYIECKLAEGASMKLSFLFLILTVKVVNVDEKCGVERFAEVISRGPESLFKHLIGTQSGENQRLPIRVCRPAK